MSINELKEEIDDLAFYLDFNVDILTDEKTRYFVYSQYYYNQLLSMMNYTNVYYIISKINNLIFSTNQLMYEADVEQRFWLELIKLMKDPNFIYIYDDIRDDIEDLLLIFPEHAMYRSDFSQVYEDAFNDFLKNRLYLDDCYYKSDVDRNEYNELLNKYTNKLIKTKK